MKINGKQLSDVLRTESTPFDIVYSDRTVGDLNGAVRFTAINDTGSAIGKGKVVALVENLSGNLSKIILADADSASMPAFGLTAQSSTGNGDEVDVITFGNLKGIDTSTLDVGDTLYVSTTAGEYTTTAPTGSGSRIQNLGMVVKSDSNGIIKVGGAGRSNATPNLDEGHFFVGNASNESTQSAYQLPTAIGTSGQVLTSNGTNVTFQDASGGGSDYTALTTDVAKADFSVTNYYTTLEESTVRSIYLPNFFEGDSATDFMNKRITVENLGLANVRVLLRTGGTSANRLYGSYDDLGTTNFNNDLIVVGGNYHAYIDIPPKTNYKLSLREHATVSYWFVEPFTLPFDNFTPQNNDILAYNSTTGKWENSADRAELVYSFQNSNFTAEVGNFYYVDSSGGDITISLSTANTVVGQRFKIFKASSANSITIYEQNAVNNIDPDDGALPATSKRIEARSMIEFIAYSVSADFTYTITPQIELNDSDLNASGEFLIYDATDGAKHLTTAPYTLPTSDGAPNQMLVTNGSGVLSFTDQPSGTAPTVTTDSSGTDTTVSTYTGSEEVYLINNGANNVTITLPTASTVGAGYKYQIKRLGTGTVTVTPASGTIDANASFPLASQYDAVTLVSDNSNYYII